MAPTGLVALFGPAFGSSAGGRPRPLQLIGGVYSTAFASANDSSITPPPSFICPVCSQLLKHQEAGPIQCGGCGQTIPQTLGIPDLRGPGHEDTKTDRTIAGLLLEQFPTASYEELLAIRIEKAPTYRDLIGHEVDYLRGEASRSQLMIDMFHRRLRDQFGQGETHTALDMGSGTGTSLPILAAKYGQVIGLEPSLPELILAQKYLEINGITNVQLVQAYGQKIPYQTGTFDYINALNVLEHVFTINPVMAEIHRTLKPEDSLPAIPAIASIFSPLNPM